MDNTELQNNVYDKSVRHMFLTAVNRQRSRKKREWKSCFISSNVETINCCLTSVRCLISQTNDTSQGL